MIFVYEFSLNSEVNIENSLRTNWFSLINDTTEDGFKTKYMKSGIDRTTLTILPILLKALKKNVFLEKILEEQSSSSPSYEGKETTEYNFDKNVFTRNWFRIPSSKLYAITYKTMPIAYYRSPSKNLEYFTKIRKIRDYQRVINYVDKMISGRVYIGSTKPMLKGETMSEKPMFKSYPKIEAKPKHKSKHVPLQTEAPNIKIIQNITNAKINEKTINCKCPSKLGELLHKILSGIEKLLPIDASTETNYMTDCHHKKNLKQKDTLFHAELTDPIINENIVSRVKTDQQKTMDPDKAKIIPIQEISPSDSQYFNDFKTYESSTVMLNDQLDTTDGFTKTFTKSMMSANKSRKMLHRKSILGIIQRNNEILDEKKPIISFIDHNKYNNHLTKTGTTNHLKNSYSNEFLKNNEINRVEELSLNTSNDRKQHINNLIINEKPELLRQMTLTKNDLLMNLNKSIYQLIDKDKDKNIQIKHIPIETTTSLPHKRLTTKPASITDSNITITKIETVKSTENILSSVNEEIDDQSNITEEDLLKQIESSFDPLTETNASATSRTELLWEDLKNENLPAWKSMMPNLRPIYLEIQRRNDFKHENQDYDLNIINTYDNIPNY